MTGSEISTSLDADFFSSSGSFRFPRVNGYQRLSLIYIGELRPFCLGVAIKTSKKASVDRMQTLLPLASFIPPPCRLNNEQQCYLFYSVTWLKQTLTIFSKIYLKLSFILASLKLLHNPLRNFAKNCIKCAKKQEYFDSLNNILTIT